MKYTEVTIKLTPYSQQAAEILTALLAELGFDSFTDNPEGLTAYIPTHLYNDADLNRFFNDLTLDIKAVYTVEHIEEQNWNKQWESNFEPITVENFCRVRAPFHKAQEGFKLEIIIEPKMAFGTGHHQTTWLMTREIFGLDIKGKSVLDMGCGTGILAIVAEKLGAANVKAIDNDSWAYENAKENVAANNCFRIDAVLGDAANIGNHKFDTILANINLNILLDDMGKYVDQLNPEGLLIMSGILTSDIATIEHAAKQHGLTPLHSKTKDDWALVHTIKTS
jgi:ribosomal protein L11 methyltransferase